MTDLPDASLLAGPDGKAELRLVLRLSWTDIASLGQEASRLATELQRSVSFEEAVAHRLSAHSRAAQAQAQVRAEAARQPAAEVAAPSVEQARQASELTRRAAASSAALEAGHAAAARHGATGPGVSRLPGVAPETGRPGEHFLSAG